MAELVPLDTRTYVMFHGEPPPYRIQGVAIMDGGEPVMLGGIGFHQDWIEVWMDMKPEAKRYPKLLLKAGHEVVRTGARYGLPMYATADEDHDTAPAYLSRLGFVQDGELWSIQ